ncbi:hypothetical protein AK914_09290 [Listeria monocytogenes]|uniref:Thiopeptide-type bacteriocin biosynthesis domain-containing protein n=1 Tax=Listeria monocytogenes TaxID=1639 RepID=A0AAN3BET8_LISMN|nr:hypothetical protein [Listeria monocytogenes]EAC8542040.1 hypothetical protein [Listeria monocytogenes]EAC8548042.1 hypothetical protein [Listeria monocytogenes]EAC8934570.1 hypothetical protein [Listeria monocytogenes]EAC9162064.1 hypothetical protein [Listeria monocytogenes]
MWTSLHIYYYDNQDYLVRNLIYPVIADIEKQFFFIRYWDGGPHIRLRVKNLKESHTKYLVEQCSLFLKKNPSTISIDAEIYSRQSKALSEQEKEGTIIKELIENNSIKLEKYNRESEKYFGIQGLKIAEEQFYYSSQLVISFLMEKPNVKKKYIFSSILINILIDIFLTDMSFSEKTEYLDYYISYWTNFTKTSHSEVLKWRKNISTEMILFCINPLNIISQTLLDDIVQQFSNTYQAIQEKLPLKAKYSLLFNFIHLTNNRLGLNPKDEICVAAISSSVVSKKNSFTERGNYNELF